MGDAWCLLTSFRNFGILDSEHGERIVSKAEPILEAVRRWYGKAMQEIKPHSAVVARIGEALHSEGELSAERVERMVRGVKEGRCSPLASVRFSKQLHLP